MAKVQQLSEDQVLHLLQLASGLLRSTDGDVVEAMRRALPLHASLLRGIRDDGIRSDLGPVEALLHVPSSGGLAVKVERHPALAAVFPTIDPDRFDPVEPSDVQPVFSDLEGHDPQG